MTPAPRYARARHRKRTLRAGVALAASLACAAALAQGGPPLAERAKGIVARLDLDRDGRVTLLEYATGKLRDLNGGGGGPHRLTPKSDAGLRGLDADKDGVITAAEYARSYVAEEFRAIDANRDQALDAAEVAAALARAERAEKGGREKGAGFVDRYDQDRNGKVERTEWPGCDAVFERLDANRDGVVSAADAP